MNKVKITRANLVVGMVIILFCFGIVFWALTNNIETVYLNNLLLDTLYLQVCLFLVLFYINKNGFDLFDPLYFVSSIYLMMFFVTPIRDIIVEKYQWFGYSLFQYGLRSSAIAFIGYISMYFAYSIIVKSKSSNLSITVTESNLNSYITRKDKNRNHLYILYIMYFIALFANIYYLVHSGFGNVVYILTLGIMGSSNNGAVVSNIGYISMLSYSLPTIVLLLWEYSNNKVIKLILFIPMLILQVARGFRFFVIQIAVTFFAYYYIRNKKRPHLRSIVPVLVVMMVFVLIMTMFRYSIRSGSGIDFSYISSATVFTSLDEAFWDNLRIYQNVYGMVGVIPSHFPFVGLRQILLGTLYMAIPRFLWPNKISSYGGEGLRVIIGNNIGGGQAYPTLGEYYYAFGVFGVVLFMSIFGFWLRRLKDKYMNSSDSIHIIYFSVMLGCCLQLIIRGYFPSNFWYLVFAILPLWIVRLVKK